MQYLHQIKKTKHYQTISKIHNERKKWVSQNKKGFLRYREPFRTLSSYSAQYTDCTNDTVIIGRKEEISEPQYSEIHQCLKQFMPWRKGPFSVFGIEIDAEWRSEKKWQRITPHLPGLGGKVVCDIGCNNGYYMFRMQPHKPAFILGLEPSIQHYYCFQSLNAMAGFDKMEIDLLGAEHIHLFESFFDIVFLMGIIYHRPSPIDTLRDICSSLKPGGSIIVESQALPGDDPIALFPDKTYAKVPGTYFVPTGSCLCNWLDRSGFIDIELFHSHPMSQEEQRRTEWMVFESYQDFIHPDNPHQTMEGYPSPHRVFIKASKKK